MTSRIDPTLYDPTLDIWPDLRRGQKVLRPARVGVDRRTGKPLFGWAHTEQSMTVIFQTRYHERVLRRWVGSFVPHILGENTTARVVGRFYWAIATALDLWEPNYSLLQVQVRKRDDDTPINSPEQVRSGHLTVSHVGVHMPRGHLGDASPERRLSIGLIFNNGVWERGGTTIV